MVHPKFYVKLLLLGSLSVYPGTFNYFSISLNKPKVRPQKKKSVPEWMSKSNVSDLGVSLFSPHPL